MQVKLKSLQHTYLITVSPDLLVADLRQKLPQTECEDRRFRWKGQFLSEKQTISACGIHDSEVILLVGPAKGLWAYEVHVHSKDLHTTVTCSPSTTVQQFKRMCEYRLQTSLRLFQASSEGVSLPSTALLSDFCTQKPASILFQQIEPTEPQPAGFDIQVMFLTGRMQCMKVTSDTTMLEVKEWVREIQGIERMPDIVVAGKMPSNCVTLSDLEVVEGTKFHVVHRCR